MTTGATAEELTLFIPITKIDEQQRLIYGTITDELVDKSGEAFDYATSKPYYEAWSGEIAKATDGKSVGNLRVMHTSKVAGKLTELQFDDATKRVSCVAKVVDDGEWNAVLEGLYSGFSQGGRYVKRWEADGVKRYTVDPKEVSLVDNPCLTTARFEVVKADGTTEARAFKNTKADGQAADVPAGDAPATDPPAGEAPAPEAPVAHKDDEADYVRRVAAATGMDQSAEAYRTREMAVVSKVITT